MSGPSSIINSLTGVNATHHVSQEGFFGRTYGFCGYSLVLSGAANVDYGGASCNISLGTSRDVWVGIGKISATVWTIAAILQGAGGNILLYRRNVTVAANECYLTSSGSSAMGACNTFDTAGGSPYYGYVGSTGGSDSVFPCF